MATNGKATGKPAGKTVTTLVHEEASRANIPTAEYQSVLDRETAAPLRIAYERRNRDLDPQLVWRGKDEQDWSDLVVQAPPLYIQEKIHPKVLIDDLLRQTQSGQPAGPEQLDLFADFNGIPEGAERTEFYRHEQNWTNRMILGDSLQVMASLAEREALRGKVQCIYLDPPYGIRFNSNFQWSTTSRDVKDGNAAHITREPEQVKAFRDTWRDGIHSYLTYLRDRLTVARDLLSESGSIFVQIGDENVHRVRALMDEVFGDANFVSLITLTKAASQSSSLLAGVNDFVLWYARNQQGVKYRQLFEARPAIEDPSHRYICVEDSSGSIYDLTVRQKTGDDPIPNGHFLRMVTLTSQTGSETSRFGVSFEGSIYRPPGARGWSTGETGIRRVNRAGRMWAVGKSLRWKNYHSDYPYRPRVSLWSDIRSSGFGSERIFTVQTQPEVVQRCILMTTDPGDLVLDPTCGSGTTAYVAEQWGRRWITIDTSRVALALARARVMGARYPYYLLADSRQGQLKEADLTHTAPSSQPTRGDLRHGFVYERVPHITLKSIANNAEIDVIWEKWEERLAPLREQLSVESGEWRVKDEGRVASEEGREGNEDAHPLSTHHTALSTRQPLEEWQIPRERPDHWPLSTQPLLTQFWEARIARQREIDASIAAKAEFEYLYDKPYVDSRKVRVAGPFTVESLSPHRVLGVDENDELIDRVAEHDAEYAARQSFPQMILENLRVAGVQQAHKEDRITFTSLSPWPGEMICAEGRYEEVGGVKDEWGVASEEGREGDGGAQPLSTHHSSLTTGTRRAGIFIGPEFGTVTRPDLVAAAREASDAGFDVLIACAFSYDAHATEFTKLGPVPVLKARMNADLHMAEDLKNTGKGNLFVIFGEPDITVASEEWLVDSDGRRVAPYEIFKLLSGAHSLAEVNRLGSADLRDYADISCRRAVWDYIANAAGGNLDSGEHRGGAGAAEHGGVSAVAWRCAGLPGGAGDVSDVVRAVAATHAPDIRAFAQRLRRDQQDAQRHDEIALHSPLTTLHYTQVQVNGVDVFHPQTGEVRSDGPEGIACWFIDTDYNEESFFVRHAYFLGQNDPYGALKTTLKAEIDEDAWESLHSAVSRPFPKPANGRIAVKVINHLGDEVMKVFRVASE